MGNFNHRALGLPLERFEFIGYRDHRDLFLKMQLYLTKPHLGVPMKTLRVFMGYI